MRFLELHLLAYGPFTDHVLDLSQNPFHLVFGPNEAGKSTTLRAIDSLMFGIPSRTEDNFLHKYGDMKVGAKIINADLRELAFVRKKKQKKSLVSLDAAEKPLAENSLDAFLKGMERERFSRLYCIDHDEFRSGGELMRDLKGLANESLVAASHGGGFGDVESNIADEANELWSSKRRSTKIKKQIAEYDQAKADRRTHEARAQEWQSLSEQLDDQHQKKNELLEQLSTVRAKQNRLKRLREALPLVAEWKGLTAQLAEHGSVKILPDTYSTDKRISCVAEMSSANGRLRALDEKLRVLEGEIESSAQLPEVLEASDAIDAVQRRIDAFLEAQESLANDEATADTALKEIQHWLKDAGSDLAPESANELIIQSEVQAAIEDLTPQEESLREKPIQLDRQQQEVVRELETIDQRLEDLGNSLDTQRLAIAVKDASQNLQLERLITELRREVLTKQTNAQLGLERLPGWSGSLDELARCKVPLRETVDQFAERRDQLENSIEGLTKQQKATQRELQQTQAEIAASQRASAVVTEGDLTASRGERDRGWELIKKTKFSGVEDASAVQQFAGPHTLDAAYEARVSASDEIADRLRREAKRVGEMAKQQERESSLQRDLEELGNELLRQQEVLQKIEDEWLVLWRTAGVTDARTPREMRSWLDKYAELLTESNGIGADQLQVTEHEQKLRSQIENLRGVVKNFDANCQLETLTSLHSHAEAMLESNRSIAQEHEQLTRDRRRLQRELERLESALEMAKEKRAAWKIRWTSAMESIGCNAEVTAAQAIARVRCLSQLGQAHRGWSQAKARSETARKRVREFESDVGTLQAKISPETSDLSPVEVANQLREKLQEARSLKQAADERIARRADLVREIEELQSDVTALKSTLDHFLVLAGADDLDGLDTIERASGLALQKNKVENDLRRMSAGSDLDAFIEEARGLDADKLEAQISELSSEITDLEVEREQVVSRIQETKTKRSAFDGSDAAAQADQAAMNALSQIHADARTYVTLRIAEAMLRQQVERYREENKDPLLARASQYFTEMTCGEFSGLQSDYDEQGRPIIVANRRSGEQVLTTAMSDGTLDPLFLSLRLAYLHDKIVEFEPMPLVVDDILIHLDDERALATMKVLAEFSKLTQVLFFTHHQRLRELAEANLSSDVLTVHELERNARERKARPR